MNYKNKREEVTIIIKEYLNKKKTIEELQEYSWNMIEEFSEKNQFTKTRDADENVFWFAIWQIQHLASEDHLKDGTLERDLKIILKYLLNQAPMPPNTYGLPPF